ncbi:hypothetical protein WJX73_007188 [Symbiochloris irregularis]|uniref:Coenzyme Q-binding protein COQ10 START domain-containing protein n=1 Tax=Symbiochloris irregularis TaxID=706552 RepID=A0AAW1NS07_9CHLO
MGGAVSRLPGKRGVQAAIDKAGLPLQVDGDADDNEAKGPPPPPTITEPYDQDGWFTGVRSTVVIKKPSSAVYNSLKTDLHKVFTPMTECHDEVREEGEAGAQTIFRIVRIPFKVAFVTGNLKMRLNVEQSPKTGEIHFDNVKEGALISNFVACFKISPPPADQGDSQESTVTLDTKIAVKRLPPPPFKGLVKGVMINKIDSCMVDLVNFHGGSAMSRKMSKRRSSIGRSRRASTESFHSARSAPLRESVDGQPQLRAGSPLRGAEGASPSKPAESP